MLETLCEHYIIAHQEESEEQRCIAHAASVVSALQTASGEQATLIPDAVGNLVSMLYCLKQQALAAVCCQELVFF